MAFVEEGKVTNDKLQIFYIEKVCLLCLSKKNKKQKTIMVFLYLCACRMCTADKKKRHIFIAIGNKMKLSVCYSNYRKAFQGNKRSSREQLRGR